MSGAQAKEGTNPLEMSDEEFLKMNGPAEEPAAEEEEEAIDEEIVEEEPDPAEAEELEEAAEEPGDEEEPGNDDPAEEPADSAAAETSDSETSEEKADENDDKPADDPKDEAGSTDYKAFYEQVMAPFKANGKTITLRDSAEVIQLMQMGANYTQKMQALQPHRKVLLMLQNHDLLDEGKLSYLVDLSKGDPQAVRKLVKDSGIDPMDIDVDSDSEYTPGNHSVTNEEVSFRGVLEEVASTDAGKKTVSLIDQTWDQSSKSILWEQPQILEIIHAQRESGVYDQIVAEIDRQKTLGQIPHSTPFLEAYKNVGDTLASQGAFGTPTAEAGPAAPANPPRTPAHKKAATPKPKVANGEKAKAASTTRNTPRASAPKINPLALSDEEFLALDQMKHRV